jgi:hypothetical protein
MRAVVTISQRCPDAIGSVFGMASAAWPSTLNVPVRKIS